MGSASAGFKRSARQLRTWLDVYATARQLAGSNYSAITTRHPVGALARKIRDAVRKGGSTGVTFALEGAYLSAYAEYELAVRGMIEDSAQHISRRLKPYAKCPDSFKSAHEKGCATILQRMDWDQFAHLTQVQVIGDLQSCLLSASKGDVFCIRPEAISYSDRNFVHSVVQEKISSLGLNSLWPKVAARKEVLSFYGTKNSSIAQQMLTQELDRIVKQRNTIIHRGRTAYTPSDADVRRCLEVFELLLTACEAVVRAYCRAL